MQELNLPSFDFRVKTEGSGNYIFDSVRKRYVLLTPEEWVRQNFMQYLIQVKDYPSSLIAVEKQISVNYKPFRFDLLVYTRNGEPFLIAEIKAPHIKITQEAFDQVVRYNMALKVKLVIVSNGIDHYVCEVDYSEQSYRYLQEVPGFR